MFRLECRWRAIQPISRWSISAAIVPVGYRANRVYGVRPYGGRDALHFAESRWRFHAGVEEPKCFGGRQASVPHDHSGIYGKGRRTYWVRHYGRSHAADRARAVCFQPGGLRDEPAAGTGWATLRSAREDKYVFTRDRIARAYDRARIPV